MKNSDSPVFTVGAPRSGTTLTARLMGNHSNIFMPGETHFLNDIYARRRSLGDPQVRNNLDAITVRLSTLYSRLNEFPDQERIDRLLASGALASALSGCRSYKDVFTTFMEIQMEGEGKARWGNQVPREVFEIQVLLEMFPDAKIIGCVRDVRDFLLSYQGKWRRESEETAVRLKKLYHPVITSMIWRKSNSALEQARKLYPQNVTISRYEDLVSDPERTLRYLCEFVGEAFEPEMLETQFSNSSAQERESGIFQTGINRWCGQLPESDVFLAQFICGKLMRQYHYQPTPTHPRVSSLTGIILSTPFKLFHALHANRTIRGPLVPYLWKRIRPTRI